MKRLLAITTQRNEGAFLLEWLAHHRACGFTDFIICSNDCNDGSDRMLDHLAATGQVIHMPNPGPHPQSVQFAALQRAGGHAVLQAADWVMSLDIDEFVNVHAGDHSLTALLSALPEATAIALTWRMFGNAGVRTHPEAGQLPTFIRAAPRVLWWPARARMVKTLYRNDGTYARPGIHRPKDRASGRPAPRWFDGSGQQMPARAHDHGLGTQPGRDCYALAQINHYALGSVEDFLLKRDRGRANRDDGRGDLAYWVDRNFCDEADDTISALAPLRDRILADLRADPLLAGLEAEARHWRRTRIAELLAQGRWRALYGQLLMSSPSRILTRDEARGITHPRRGAATDAGTPGHGVF